MSIFRRARQLIEDELLPFPGESGRPAVGMDPAFVPPSGSMVPGALVDIDRHDWPALLKERDELRGLIETALDALSRSPLYGGQRPGDLVAAVETLLLGFRNLVESQEQAALELRAERRRNEDLHVEAAQLAAQVAALRNHTSSAEAARWKRVWEQDRRNLVAMEDRLARAEGRRTSSTSYSGGVSA